VHDDVPTDWCVGSGELEDMIVAGSMQLTNVSEKMKCSLIVDILSLIQSCIFIDILYISVSVSYPCCIFRSLAALVGFLRFSRNYIVNYIQPIKLVVCIDL